MHASQRKLHVDVSNSASRATWDYFASGTHQWDRTVPRKGRECNDLPSITSDASCAIAWKNVVEGNEICGLATAGHGRRSGSQCLCLWTAPHNMPPLRHAYGRLPLSQRSSYGMSGSDQKGATDADRLHNLTLHTYHGSHQTCYENQICTLCNHCHLHDNILYRSHCNMLSLGPHRGNIAGRDLSHVMYPRPLRFFR